MKSLSIVILGAIMLSAIQVVSGQTNDQKTLEMELIVTDEQKIILFGSFALAVIGIFVYLARDIILRKKTSYDSKEFDSKNDKTYEKYHSDWSDDYEEFGTRKNTKENKEFRDAFQNSTLPDYYKTLEVAHDASQDEIKNRYRELAKKYTQIKTRMKNLKK